MIIVKESARKWKRKEFFFHRVFRPRVYTEKHLSFLFWHLFAERFLLYFIVIAKCNRFHTGINT